MRLASKFQNDRRIVVNQVNVFHSYEQRCLCIPNDMSWDTSTHICIKIVIRLMLLFDISYEINETKIFAGLKQILIGLTLWAGGGEGSRVWLACVLWLEGGWWCWWWWYLLLLLLLLLLIRLKGSREPKGGISSDRWYYVREMYSST